MAPEEKSLLLNPKTIVSEMQKMMGQIEAALPRHITPERMGRIAITACRQNPKLFRSTRESFFGAIITASQLGLEPGINGQCYLVPYKNKEGLYICTFIPGWRGYMDLLARTGRAAAWTNAVYEDDEFDYSYGSKPFVHHKPGKWYGNAASLRFTYAVGAIKGMEESPVIEVWPAERIWAHRDRNNKVGQDHYSFAYPEMYARKLPLMQTIKYMPMSVELNTASALDVSGTEGRQRLTIEGAIKGTYEDDSKESPEIEYLMEKLNWDEEKRNKVRANYENRPEQLLAYLKTVDFDTPAVAAAAPPATPAPPPESKPAPVPVENLDAEPPEPPVQAAAKPAPPPPPAKGQTTMEPPPKRKAGRPSREEMAQRQAEQQPEPSAREQAEKVIDDTLFVL